MTIDPLLAGAAALLAANFGAVPTAGADPLAAHRWKDRLVVVIAPSLDDPRLGEQRALLRAAARGTDERDLVLIAAVGDSGEARALRDRFAGGKTDFQAILVGKDGGAKLRSDKPISAEQLFREIDAMPMRRQEMRKR